MKKIDPLWELNHGPLAHESSTLTTELQQPWCGEGGHFKNQAADLGPVLVDTCFICTG